MSTSSCANCNTPHTESHLLKLFNGCKTVSYCNRACQKAKWRAHKSACRQSKVAGDEKANSGTDSREIANTITRLEATAKREAAGESSIHSVLGPAEILTIPEGSCRLWLPPTPELPRGHWRIIEFPVEYLAEISHLSQEEQGEAKDGVVAELLAFEEANMTPEMREERRLMDAEAGKHQRRFLEREAAKKAKDGESK